MPMSNRKKRSCDSTLKAAIIGCGWVAGGYDQHGSAPGVRTHAKAYALDERTELVAACDADPKRLQAFGEAWGVAHTYTDVRAMLQDVSPDIVSICTPDESHFDLLCLCLEFPCIRAVWCEKPLAKTSAGCADLVDSYRDASVVLLVNYMRSFCAQYQQLKGRLRSDEFGALLKIEVHYTKGIIHNGSHAMDLLIDWLGEPDSMHVSHAFVDHDAEDPTVDACLKFGEVPVYFMGLDEGSFSFFTLTLFTEKGVVSLEDFGRKLVVRAVDANPQKSGHKVLGEPVEYDTKLSFAMADALSSLVEAVQDERPEVNGYRAVRVLEVTESLAETGRKVVANVK
jgi:predicted dehydrogenase